MSYTPEQERYLESMVAEYLVAFEEGNTERCRKIVLQLEEDGYEKEKEALYEMAAELIPY